MNIFYTSDGKVESWGYVPGNCTAQNASKLRVDKYYMVWLNSYTIQNRIVQTVYNYSLRDDSSLSDDADKCGVGQLNDM